MRRVFGIILDFIVDCDWVIPLTLIGLLVALTVFIVWNGPKLDQGVVVEKEFVKSHMSGKSRVPDRWHLTVEGLDEDSEKIKEDWLVPPMVYRDVEVGDIVIREDVVVQ